ncbi:hypothetical protein RCG24_21115 [Neobacillus sp. OS1-32]|nr:hypothetical protein [Neobacillus sp. OS1-32]WML30344.1 hypothetical protein RCG24_21115 [Neobacillus sp. OS1-32]
MPTNKCSAASSEVLGNSLSFSKGALFAYQLKKGTGSQRPPAL